MIAITVFLYITGVAVFLSVLLGYMWLTTWQYREKFGIHSVIALIVPVVCLLSIPVVADALGTTLTYPLKWVVLAVVFVLCIATIALATVFSIIKYRIEDYDPNYAAFGAVSSYSIILAVLSLIFIL